MSARPRPMVMAPDPPAYVPPPDELEVTGAAVVTVTVPGRPPIVLRALAEEDALVVEDGVKVAITWA